ncbi:MAG: MFS transporter [Betaproteobacteria bacterium]|nr:MAG: MFS transporter [Betaproteobacteria bacterium]
MPAHLPDSAYAVRRLLVALAIMTIGNGGMYAVVTVLPTVQAEFGVARADASLPYTLLMVCFGFGGILMGRLADRHGIVVPLAIGAAGLGIGYVAASLAGSIWTFAIAHGLFIGLLGSSAMFAPLIADTSLWFVRRRGIAVGVCASGNYLAGALWPPIVQYFVEIAGWRQTYFATGVLCAVSIGLLATMMRERAPVDASLPAATPAGPGVRASAADPQRPFGLSPAVATALLCLAGLACCVAMSMPQVHIVALCTDLGFGTARGAQMLALMLAFGIASRLISGYVCDHIGGLRTLVLGSFLQGVALLLYLRADGLVSLYVVSALFGLFQGGIVPAYAIIIREHFPAAEAGTRVGTVIMFTLFGMALGGWMSGKAFDLTGSYEAAFVNGIAWNLLNLGVAVYLIQRVRRLPGGWFGTRQPAA